TASICSAASGLTDGSTVEYVSRVSVICECPRISWTINSYTGKYRVEGNKWITKVDGAWNVVWVGTEQERTFELKGKTLSVMTPWSPNPFLAGRLVRGYLTFERED